MIGNPVPLDPFYYLKNFERVLHSLRERYADLLCEDEREFIRCFATIPQASRALLVRMVMRSGELFRESKLNYAEIGDTRAAVLPLTQQGWVDASPQLTFEELHRLLTKSEFSKAFRRTGRERCRKSELVALLQPHYPHARPFRDWCQGLGDAVYRLCVAERCERFRLMFFGNFSQHWSEFVLADLGIFTFEKVDLPRHSRAFRCREDIDAFAQLNRCRELMSSKAPLYEVVEAMPAELCGSDWLQERRQKLLFDLARAFERSGDVAQACAIYSRCTDAAAADRALRLQQRVQRELGIRARTPRPKRNATQPSRFELVLDKPASGCSIEYHARNYLARLMPEGATVHYVENGLINSLFGLLCWNAVFAPVPGAFFHEFHRGPADLSSSEFYRRREREFAACFAELESGSYQTTIRETYARKVGIQSPFVAWSRVSESLLEQALLCFPAEHLRQWFEWIARDVPRNRTGFPDLIQLWPQERRYRMIEVKGPRDRLQENQRRVLKFCAAHGMPAVVCHVRWAEDAAQT